MKDQLIFTGSPTLTLRSGDGQIKQQFTVKNLVVQSGKTYFASRATQGSVAVMSHMAAGTINTAPIISNTALGGELARVALTSSVSYFNTVTYVATFGQGVATGAITEIGIFNAALSTTPGQTMLCRAVFPPVNKSVDDTLDISWVIAAN